MKIKKARIDIINKLKNANASINVTNKQNGVRAEVILPLELVIKNACLFNKCRRFISPKK